METQNEFEWPVVTVLICTYDRPFEFGATFGALSKHLIYPNLKWHIADDGTPGDYVASLVDLMSGVYSLDDMTHSITDRKGWGVNVNKALSEITSKFVYFTEDDYVLKRELDLRPYVALMMTDKHVGMVRFGISGHDGIRARLREVDISHIMPGYSEAVGQGSTASGKVNYWDISLDAQTDWGAYGFFRYSNRPHLKHRRFHTAYGMYPEGLPLATTEQYFNNTITAEYRKSEGNTPAIAVPCQWTYWYFDHIGKSRQGTEADLHE